VFRNEQFLQSAELLEASKEHCHGHPKKRDSNENQNSWPVQSSARLAHARNSHQRPNAGFQIRTAADRRATALDTAG